jgi:hypothetical protein
MGYNDISYNRTYFGYGISNSCDQKNDHSVGKCYYATKLWNSFLKKKLPESEFPEIELYKSYESFIACYEPESRSDCTLILGYEIDSSKPEIKSSDDKTTNYNFSFNFPPNCKDLFAEFLAEEDISKFYSDYSEDEYSEDEYSDEEGQNSDDSEGEDESKVDNNQKKKSKTVIPDDFETKKSNYLKELVFGIYGSVRIS